MKILSLDLSTVCSGWDLFESTAPTYEATKLHRYGTIEPLPKLSESERYFCITHQVDMLIRLFRPDQLVIEDTFCGKNVTTLKTLNRLAGHVQSVWFRLRQRDAAFYMPAQTRKSVGLSGRAEKPEIVEGVNKFFKLRGKVTDHNAADSIVLGYHHILTGAFAPAGGVEDPTLDTVETIEPPSPSEFVKPLPKDKKRKKENDKQQSGL